MQRYRRTISALALGGLTAAGLLLLLGGRLVAVGADPGVLFVEPDGSGDCSQGAPCDLRTALSTAGDGTSIYLAQGTYTGSGGAVVTITRSISLYGGWDGRSSTPVVRDAHAYPATIDGEGTRRGMFIEGDIRVALEGVRLTGGNATGRGGDPWGNDAGGGGYIDQATVSISDCLVYGNTASTTSAGSGGGLFLRGSVATVRNSTVISNIASATSDGYGGGLVFWGRRVTVSDNTVQSNTASIGGWGYGGGAYFLNTSATLRGNTVVGNIASSAARGWGGGLYVWYSKAAVSSNAVRGNIASTAEQGYGGGLTLSNSAATLSGTMIVSNSATANLSSIGNGGGLYAWESGPVTLTNSLVVDNYASTAGSGLWLEGTSLHMTSGRLLHMTIADNRGGGQGISVAGHTTLASINTIVAGHHSVGIDVTTGSTATMEATLWHNNGSNTAGEGKVVSTSNVTGDPAFVNPSAWDYHLRSSSHAIDVGVDAGVRSDLDGDPRPIGGGYDIGADEFEWRVYLPLLCGDRSGGTASSRCVRGSAPAASRSRPI